MLVNTILQVSHTGTGPDDEAVKHEHKKYARRKVVSNWDRYGDGKYCTPCNISHYSKCNMDKAMIRPAWFPGRWVWPGNEATMNL